MAEVETVQRLLGLDGKFKDLWDLASAAGKSRVPGTGSRIETAVIIQWLALNDSAKHSRESISSSILFQLLDNSLARNMFLAGWTVTIADVVAYLLLLEIRGPMTIQDREHHAGMEVLLNRVDYLQVASTSRYCLGIFPANQQEEKATQKVVVGDQDGVLQVFHVKKGEINIIFRTLPETRINRVSLSGSAGNPQDKIFACYGSTVKGFNKKGKQFLGFGTNLAEDIQHMCVRGSDLLVCSHYVYNHYRDCVETGYYLCGDEIRDIICLPPNKITGLTTIIACGDRCLRVIKGSKMAFEVTLESVPTCLELADGDGGVSGDSVMFGTEDGHVGMVKLGTTSATIEWIMTEDYNTGIVRSGAVSCMAHHDITGDGYKDLIVGREDGSVDLYSYQDAETLLHRFNYAGSESVTTVAGGIVGHEGYQEILVSTFSGWIFGLTRGRGKAVIGLEPEALGILGGKDRIQKLRVLLEFLILDFAAEGMIFGLTNCPEHLVLGVTSGGTVAVRLHEKIHLLKNEIEELQEMVAVERKNYHSQTQGSEGVLSAVPTFFVKDQMILNREEASYVVSLEVQTPIDIILLQSDIPVDLLDFEKNSAVVSFSKCDPDPADASATEKERLSGIRNHLLATYRCQANTTRLEVKIRTIEGQYGTLQAYIIPRVQPKSCVVRAFPIKPLSLHTRTKEFDNNRPFSVLILKGNFSFAEVHSWVFSCLPEIPERPPAEDSATWYFASTFLDTILECEYKRGEAQFRSDNVSTVSILKEFLTKEATRNMIRLELSCDVSKESVIHALSLMSPKLQAHLKLSKQVQLIDGLKEIELHESDISFLDSEYQEILKNADQLKAQYNKQPCYLDRLYGMITDLYIDQYKFQGVNVKSRVPLLLDLLDNNYSLDSLTEFFQADF
ncbi:unnamed protein product [Notodromas monacha]|uniref:Bardet-Biedl syndrome 7 protein homolog n=1 Tax=Notodromas monacha TaxID=399045 RepID=A0A7R9BK13_9CRUS|nr:unnamed protein product [Notodromas monacha]CAG0915803.1 unnamed protein product [Notodromas monacha]